MKGKRPEVSPLMRSTDAAEYLRGQHILDDFLAAKLVKPCAVKPTKTGGRGRGKGRSTVLFSRADIEWCADELLAGRYPKKSA